MLYYARIPKYNGMIRNVAIHICIWCNKHVIPYGDCTYYGCIHANPYHISDCWGALALPSIFLPNCYALMNVDILAYLRIWINCYPICMTKIKSCSNLCFFRKFNMPPRSARSQHKFAYAFQNLIWCILRPPIPLLKTWNPPEYLCLSKLRTVFIL